MVASGTLMPEVLELKTQTFAPGWEMIIGSDGHQFEKQVRTAGWRFFFLAENIRATALGGRTASRRAVSRLLTLIKAASFNCAEITEISSKRFLGLPYVRVTAHSRHVQESSILRSLAERSRTKAAATWAIG